MKKSDQKAKNADDAEEREAKDEGENEREKVEKEVDLVTGANGKLGKELVKSLLKKGDVVRALVKSKESIVDLPPGVVPYIGDITHQRVLDDACNGVDNVYHLAAAVSEYRYTTEELIHINVEGTRNVLDAAEKGGAKHLIFTSTIDVYGRKRKDVLTEESPLKPSDKYGYSKMLAENIVKEYASTLPYTILRLATIYGPSFEAPYFKVLKALQEGKIYLIGNGQNHLALLHVYDALQSLILPRVYAGISKNKVYNVTDGNNYTQELLFNMAADMLKVPRPKRHLSEFIVRLVAKSHGLDSDELRFLTSNRVIDITKIKSELGFKPVVEMRVGMGELVTAYLKRSHKSVIS
jgi:nucleoside-diphosphate-sugar epimerase